MSLSTTLVSRNISGSAFSFRSHVTQKYLLGPAPGGYSLTRVTFAIREGRGDIDIASAAVIGLPSLAQSVQFHPQRPTGEREK